MKNLHSNSKDTFTYWLREMKNSMSMPHASFSYMELQEMWLHILSLGDRQNQPVREAFNDIYALAYDENQNVTVTSKHSSMYKEHPYN